MIGVWRLRRLTGIGLGIALLGVTLVPTAALAGVSCDIDDTYTVSSKLPCWVDPPSVSIQVDEQGSRYTWADSSSSGKEQTTTCFASGHAEARAGPSGIDIGGYYTAEVKVGDEPRRIEDQYYPFHAEESDSDKATLKDGESLDAYAEAVASNSLSGAGIYDTASASYSCNLS